MNENPLLLRLSELHAAATKEVELPDTEGEWRYWNGDGWIIFIVFKHDEKWLCLDPGAFVPRELAEGRWRKVLSVEEENSALETLHELLRLAAIGHEAERNWWESLPEGTKWVAKDGIGEWYCFFEKPELSPHFPEWCRSDPDSQMEDIDPPPGVSPDLDWKDSLKEVKGGQNKCPECFGEGRYRGCPKCDQRPTNSGHE